MEILKFNLNSKTGMLRKPDSNNIYFSYSIIHKIAVLGILGAIIGEEGYNQKNLKIELNREKKSLPNFYNNLKNLNIAIEPISYNLSFKMQTFNNSVGYASKEEGNNLIVEEQWIEDPNWNIYILNDSSEKYQKIKKYLLNAKCEYIPYIGKNDHFANINNVELLNGEKINQVNKIDSIFTDINYKLLDIIESLKLGFDIDKNIKFEKKEILPTALDEDLGYINYKEFVFTNKNIKIADDINSKKIYKIKDKIVSFF